MLTLAAVLAGYAILVLLLQRPMMFPAPARAAAPSRSPAERILLDLPFGPVEAFLLMPAGAGPYPLLVFTHGNGELAQDWIDEFATVPAWGWAALLVEYPGYGGSAGRPSRASIRAAMLAAYDRAAADPRVDRSRIVAYGRSLGGGAATELAAARPLAAVVLESTFTSVAALARRMLVPGFLVRDRFDNLRALATYRGPVLVLHGARDEVIPVTHGRRLASTLPGAEYHELPCGHNDCARPWPIIRSFLDRHLSNRPAFPEPLR
jgi:uncharacterized protein